MALPGQMSLPEGVSFSQSRVMTMDEEIGNMIFAGGMSVVFVYLLMGFLFESFILPLSIILTIPLAGIGVACGILLVGVVVKNGIVLIDYVIRLRAAGMERTQALLTSSTLRFRPIM